MRKQKQQEKKMSEEKRACPKCGRNEFYAKQRCSGSITVVVDGDGNWLRNWCNDEYLVLDSLEYSKPEEIRELCTTCEDREDEFEKSEVS